MTRGRRTLVGRAYAAVLAAMERLDEGRGRLSPAEWASVASHASADMIRRVIEGPDRATGEGEAGGEGR